MERDFISMQEEEDPTVFSNEELRDLINYIYKVRMPDWEFYLAINGLRFFLATTKVIHQNCERIMDLVCTYYKKDSYQRGIEELELYNKFNKHLRSPKWKSICETVLNRDHHRCTRCDTKENINCYHIHYDKDVLFNEAQHLDKLTTLCSNCYKETHFPIKGNTSHD
jgi:predicted phosphoadenosine phosphosulfate sulfurtransferase